MENNILYNQLNPIIWTAPKMSPASEMDVGNIKGIYFNGLDYKGLSTKVFAYIGYPSDASISKKVPAVVLAHGGGQTALSFWVKAWNDRGYAAIALDLEGNQPDAPGSTTPVRHQYGGACRQGEFNDIDLDIKLQWMYHAISDVILANSLLRNDLLIDANKIGLSGVSWGGIIVSIVLGIDSRFAFVIPTYGCGYIDGTDNYFGKVFANNTKKLIWEPSNWIKNSKTPVLWLNGDADKHFPAVSTSLSFKNTLNGNVAIINGLEHASISPEVIYTFADSIVKGEKRLLKITQQPTKHKNSLEIFTPEGIWIIDAKLVYTTIGDIYDESSECIADWQIKQLTVDNDLIIYSVPDNTKAYYIQITDNRNATISSEVVTY